MKNLQSDNGFIGGGGGNLNYYNKHHTHKMTHMCVCVYLYTYVCVYISFSNENLQYHVNRRRNRTTVKRRIEEKAKTKLPAARWLVQSPAHCLIYSRAVHTLPASVPLQTKPFKKATLIGFISPSHYPSCIFPVF